jgi:succinate dehydrogenase/fumarate reductase flavoprotein subunit
MKKTLWIAFLSTACMAASACKKTDDDGVKSSEKAVENAREDVREQAGDVREEMKDVKEEAKDVADEKADVVEQNKELDQAKQNLADARAKYSAEVKERLAKIDVVLWFKIELTGFTPPADLLIGCFVGPDRNVPVRYIR